MNRCKSCGTLTENGMTVCLGCSGRGKMFTGLIYESNISRP